MKQKTLNLIEEAISTAGKWTWLETSNDSLQLEFKDVQLYKQTKNEYDSHSSEIAISLSDNTFFTVLYNDLEDIKFFDSEEDFSYNLAIGNFKFQNLDFLKEIANNYLNSKQLIPKIISKTSNNFSIEDVDFLLGIIFDKIAIVCGANQLNFFNDFESLNDEDIKNLSNKWWIYWVKYWKMKKIGKDYEYDSACEALIF